MGNGNATTKLVILGLATVVAYSYFGPMGIIVIGGLLFLLK